MRVGTRIPVALGAALSVLAGGATAAGSADVSRPSCSAVAERPRTVTIDGRRYVAARHAVVCEAPVAEIEVWGGLRMDGDPVARARRTCAWASACAVGTAHRNPRGVQVWRGSTAGAVSMGGAARPVPRVVSQPLKA